MVVQQMQLCPVSRGEHGLLHLHALAGAAVAYDVREGKITGLFWAL